MSACNYDVVAFTTMAIWMTLSGTALSSSIHIFTRALIGLLVFFAVDTEHLDPLTADDCVARRSLRLSFCVVGLFGLLVAHAVVPVLRRIRRLTASLPPSQQQQQMPGAWPSSWPWFVPSPSPSPSPSPPLAPAPTEVNEHWEADHLAKMASLPADCFISPVVLAARSKWSYTCPSYDDDNSAHGPSPAPTQVNENWEADHRTKMASLPADCFISPEDLAARGKRAYTCPSYDDDDLAHGPAPSSAAQPVPALVEKEEEDKGEEEEEEEGKEEDRVPWTYDGLLDLPSDYGIRARFSAATRADAALLAARVPASRDDETESEDADVERMGDSASLHRPISSTSSLCLLSSRRYQYQPSCPRRRHISSFAVARIPKTVVTPPPPVRPAVPTRLASSVLLLFFPLSRPLKKKVRSRKGKARRLLTRLGRSERFVQFD